MRGRRRQEWAKKRKIRNSDLWYEKYIYDVCMLSVYVYQRRECAPGSREKEYDRVRVRRGRESRKGAWCAFRAFCVWGRGQFIKKHVRPLLPPGGQPPVNLMLRRHRSNSESYLHNITTVTFPRHFFVLRPFFFTRSYTQAILCCIYNTTIALLCRKNPHRFPSRPRHSTHTHAHTQKPLGFIFNLQNDVEIESAATGSVAQWLFPHIQSHFFLFFFIIFIVHFWRMTLRPPRSRFLLIYFHRYTL